MYILTKYNAFDGVYGYQNGKLFHAPVSWGEKEELVGKGSLAHFEMIKNWIVGEWSECASPYSEYENSLAQEGARLESEELAMKQYEENSRARAEEERKYANTVILVVDGREYTNRDAEYGFSVPMLPEEEIARLNELGLDVSINPQYYEECSCGGFTKFRTSEICPCCGKHRKPLPQTVYISAKRDDDFYDE